MPAPYLLTEGDAAAHGTRVPVRPAPSLRALQAAAEAHATPITCRRLIPTGDKNTTLQARVCRGRARFIPGCGSDCAWQAGLCADWKSLTSPLLQIQPVSSALRLPSVASLDTESLAELPDPTELEAWLAFSPPERGPADGGLSAAARSDPSPALGAPSSYQPLVPYVQVATRQPDGCLDTLWAARYWEQAGDVAGWSQAAAPGSDSRIFSGIPIKSEQVVITPTSSSAVSVSDASPSILGQAASGTPRIGAPPLPPLAPPPFKFIIDPAYGAALRLA